MSALRDKYIKLCDCGREIFTWHPCCIVCHFKKKD